MWHTLAVSLPLATAATLMARPWSQVAAGTATGDVLSTALLVGAISALFATLGTVARSLHLALVTSLERGHARELATLDAAHAREVAAKQETLTAKDDLISALAARNDVLDGRVVAIGQLQQQDAAASRESLAAVTHALTELTRSITRMAEASTEEHHRILTGLPPREAVVRPKAHARNRTANLP